MRASKGDKKRKTEANIAAETSTDGLDEASAEEVERLIAEFGLVYERKVRAKEEMVELPAEPLAAGILSDVMMEMVEPAEPRKPTLGVGRGRGLEGLRQVPGARCLPPTTPHHASPLLPTPHQYHHHSSPLLTTPHHASPGSVAMEARLSIELAMGEAMLTRVRSLTSLPPMYGRNM